MVNGTNEVGQTLGYTVQDSPNEPVVEAEEQEQEKRPEKHIVKEGETVVSIAAMYDVTPSQLAQHNKLGKLL